MEDWVHGAGNYKWDIPEHPSSLSTRETKHVPSTSRPENPKINETEYKKMKMQKKLKQCNQNTLSNAPSPVMHAKNTP